MHGGYFCTAGICTRGQVHNVILVPGYIKANVKKMKGTRYKKHSSWWYIGFECNGVLKKKGTRDQR